MQFCKSWWGNRYIETIEDMDQARMMRGRRYARNGSVLSIDIKKNKVNAKVQGSSPRPYSVRLEFIPFSDMQKKIILDVIKESPSLAAALLSGEMPSELDDVLSTNSINLFVSDWDEINPNCSCPDWAIPCKHLAAVMYQIALEIDRNPFIIFDLHDFDIIQELSRIGLTVEKENIYNIRDITKISVAPVLNASAKKATDYSVIADCIDFSKIPVLYQNFISLLSDNPPIGFKKDFKKQLEKFYKTLSKLAESQIYNPDESEAIMSLETEFNLLYCLKGMTPFYFQKTGTNLYLNTLADELAAYLRTIPAGALKTYSHKTVFWWLSYHFSLILAKQGACIPEIVYMGYSDIYKIRWRPAVQSEIVKEIFDNLVKMIPSGLFMIETERTASDIINKTISSNAVKVRVRKSDSRKTVLSAKKINDEMLKLQKLVLDNKMPVYAENNFSLSEADGIFAVEEIISCFIDHFLSFAQKEFSSQLFSGNLQEISSLFFDRQAVCFSDFDKKSLPSAISLWLSKLHFVSGEINPVIVIEETKAGNFELSLSAEIGKDILKTPVTYQRIVSRKKFLQYRTEFVRTAGMMTGFIPEITGYIDSKGKNKIIKSLSETGQILQNVIPLIKLTGIKVILPKSLNNILNPKLALSLTAKKDKTVSYLLLDEMLAFDYKISIGDKHLDLNEFVSLTKNASGLVKFKDQYIFINPSEIEKILAEAKKHSAGINDLLAAGVSEEYNGAPLLISDEAKSIFKEIMEIKSVPLSKGLKANLRPYQERGYAWLYKNAKLGMGSLLADDMGLGKTLQVIALIDKLKEESNKKELKALVVVPTTLLTNWKKEIAKFAPDLTISIYHGYQRDKVDIDSTILLTTYGILRSDLEKFEKKKFNILVIDEAQNIKNPATAQTLAVKKIKAEIKIALTGTPVENRMTEYWSIFDFANKGYLGSLKHFRENVAIPVEAYKNHEVLSHFKKITSPFIMRRMKSDKSIISDLPDKIETDRYCNLSKEQAALYQSVVDNIMEQIEMSEGIARKGLVFKLMTALKQICNHPAHYLKKSEIKPELSGKSEALLALLSNILENNEKALIFTQYYEMGDLLVKLIIEQTGHTPFFLHGALSRKKRDEMVEVFQNDPASKIFILSLKAGGTGLNLTGAAHVIHYDLWWNPAVEAQATDRAYRIGQTKNVLVSRLISEGTFEEKINDMINAKKELADMAVSTGENWIGEMSDKELKELFKL